MTAAARHQVSPSRRAMLAKVHLGAKDLGLREDERRDVLERLTTHRSSADCTDAQLEQVLAHFKSLGWSPKPAAGGQARTGTAPDRKPARSRATSPVALKARALWISLYQLGVVRDRSEQALEAFAFRQLKVERLQWMDDGQGYRLIEALKAMAERAGWSQDMSMVRPGREVWSLKARLVNAQLHKLGRPSLKSMGLTEKELDATIAALATEIHGAAE